MKSILIPYPDFAKSAEVYAPTTKIEAVKSAEQVLNVLHQLDPPFVVNAYWDLPAVQAWRGHELSLCNFALMLCEQLGDVDKISFFEEQLHNATDGSMEPPAWMKMEEVNLSHRSELIRQSPYFYKKLWPETPTDLPLIWTYEDAKG